MFHCHQIFIDKKVIFIIFIMGIFFSCVEYLLQIQNLRNSMVWVVMILMRDMRTLE
jgi:hypothetical protein